MIASIQSFISRLDLARRSHSVFPYTFPNNHIVPSMYSNISTKRTEKKKTAENSKKRTGEREIRKNQQQETAQKRRRNKNSENGKRTNGREIKHMKTSKKQQKISQHGKRTNEKQEKMNNSKKKKSVPVTSISGVYNVRYCELLTITKLPDPTTTVQTTRVSLYEPTGLCQRRLSRWG